MLKKIKTKTIIIGSVILMALVLLIGTTFAYFTARVIGNDTAKNTQVYAGTMALRLNGSTQITCNNLYPGGTCTYNFSVENTGTLTTSYELDFVDVLNDLEVKNELVYSLTKDSQVQITENEAPSVGEMILPAVVIEPDAIQEYTLTLTFKETGEDQSYNQNKHFSARVNIRGIDSSNYLQAKVLARHINTTTPDFANSEPSNLSEEKVETNQTSSLSSNITGDKVIGSGYIFNENGGVYELTGVLDNQSYNNSSVGKYTCNSSSKYCLTMYKINEVQESESLTNFVDNVDANRTYSSLNKSGVALASSYYLDQSTGNFVLDGTIEENQTYSSSSIGKYTCNSAETVCKVIYRINVVEDATIINADGHYISHAYNYVRNSDKYTSVQKNNTMLSNSGLYQAQDDDGTSYYFRGKVDNNFVQFGAKNDGTPLKWRIVRVNGDGSIRLVSPLSVGNVKFNVENNDIKYVGFSYDNESACTKDSPCISDYDQGTNSFINNKTITNSTIKTYLENYYINTTNLSTLSDKIALSYYCNDTTHTQGYDPGNGRVLGIRYGAYNRLLESNPQLTCPDTTENYGGLYKSKIGLLSADEVNMAGLSRLIIPAAAIKNYIYAPPLLNAASLSPSWYSSVNNNRIITFQGGKIHDNNAVTLNSFVRPVINLKSDVTISGGDGTQDHPYVVE